MRTTTYDYNTGQSRIIANELPKPGCLLSILVNRDNVQFDFGSKEHNITIQGFLYEVGIVKFKNHAEIEKKVKSQRNQNEIDSFLLYFLNSLITIILFSEANGKLIWWR